MKHFNTLTLEKQLEKMEALIEKRETHFEMKSDKWQESEKGEEFELQNEELNSLAHQLQELINDINSWNDGN